MMKKRRLSGRELFLASLLLTVFSLLVCLTFWIKQGAENQKALAEYDSFCQKLYERELTSNTLGLHYSLADPKSFGITDYPVTLPVYAPKSELLRSNALASTLREFREVLRRLDRTGSGCFALGRAGSGRGALSREETYACDCLERLLSLSLEEAGFPYYHDPLSPSFGVQGTLPILLSEYAFRSKRDVEEYLQLLGQTHEYLNSMLLYEQERLAAGLPFFSHAITAVLNECDTIVTSESLATGDHFLQTSFEERLLELSKTHPMTARELNSYLEENDRLLKEVLAPAYEDLRAGMQALAPRAKKETSGLANLPRGKEYYACLLSLTTGSSKTPEEVRALLEQTLIRECEAIRNLSAEYPGVKTALQAGSHTDLGLYDTSVIFQNLLEKMQGDFPDPKDLCCAVTVKAVDPGLSAYAAPAFYLTAPIDDVHNNVIYVNPRTSPKGLELYATLAHEGFPGHLYQNAYMGTHFLSLGDSRLRQLISCGGYSEGWALYVELLSYVYAAQRLADQGRSTDAVCVLLEKHQRSMMLCLYSLIDVRIHYDGATPEEITELLSPFGMGDPAAVRSIYDYVCEAPCNYPKYYLGYLEIQELEKLARSLWGSAYTDIRFHKFLLEWGPADFESIKKEMGSRANIATRIV